MSIQRAIQEALGATREAFGYPSSHVADVLGWLGEVLEPAPDVAYVQERVQDLLVHAVYWPESVPDLSCELVEDGITPSLQILANQLAGAFRYSGSIGFGKRSWRHDGAWENILYLSDVTREGGQGSVIAQKQVEAGPVPPSYLVFDSIESHRSARDEWMDVSDISFDVQDGVATQAQLDAALQGFTSKYPRFADVLGPRVDPRLADATFERPKTSDQEQGFLDTISLMETVVGALAAQLAGDASPKTAADLNASTLDPAHPPHVVARPLIWIVQGERDRGVKEAQRILNEGLGVPLTQRWAKRIVDRGGSGLLDE